MDDAALIAAHQTGDTRAMGTLIDRHGGVLMGFLVARVGEEAEDMYQETWSRAAKGLAHYNEQGSFRAWLFQIARRQLIDQHRRRGARVQLVLVDDTTRPSPSHTAQPDQALAAADVGRSLEQTLQSMETNMAQVVRWRLIDGLPFHEIAQRQGVPLNTALGRMHRALKRIRHDLIEAGLMPQGSQS